MNYLQNIKRLAQIELALIFLVIIAGSIVRITGSGMGCPDWPKCYGHLVPPTEIEEVIWAPNSEFKEGQMILLSGSIWKAKFDIETSSEFNFDNWEKYTKHDYAKFNATHTWIEYINRLASTLAGIPMLILFILSWLNFRKNKSITIWVSLAMIFLLLEAWLGKLVVEGNLIPNQITIHMLGALLVLIALVVVIHKSSDKEAVTIPENIKTMIWLLSGLFFIQMLLGTQVREQVDSIYKELNGENRETWIGLLDFKVIIHRSFSWTSLIMAAWLLFKNKKQNLGLDLIKPVFYLILILGTSGALLYYLDIPVVLQPLHLLISSIVFVMLFKMLMQTTNSKKL